MDSGIMVIMRHSTQRLSSDVGDRPADVPLDRRERRHDQIVREEQREAVRPLRVQAEPGERVAAHLVRPRVLRRCRYVGSDREPRLKSPHVSLRWARHVSNRPRRANVPNHESLDRARPDTECPRAQSAGHADGERIIACAPSATYPRSLAHRRSDREQRRPPLSADWYADAATWRYHAIETAAVFAAPRASVGSQWWYSSGTTDCARKRGVLLWPTPPPLLCCCCCCLEDGHANAHDDRVEALGD